MKISFCLFRLSIVATVLLLLLSVPNVRCEAEEGVVINDNSATFSLVANQPRLFQIPKKAGEDVAIINFDNESVSDLQVKWMCNSIPNLLGTDRSDLESGQYMFCQYSRSSHYFVWVSSNKNITKATMTLEVVKPILLEYNKQYTFSNSTADVLPYVPFMVSPVAGSGNNIFVQLSSSVVTSAQSTTSYTSYDSEFTVSLENTPTWYVVVTTNEMTSFNITVTSKPIVMMSDTYEQTFTMTLAPQETKLFMYQVPVASFKYSRNSQFSVSTREKSDLKTSIFYDDDEWNNYYDSVMQVSNPTSETVTGNVTFFKSSLISLDSHSLHTFECTPGGLITVQFPPLNDTSVIFLQLVGDGVTYESSTVDYWSGNQGFLQRGTPPVFQLSCSDSSNVQIGISPVYFNEINATNGETQSYRLYTNNINLFYVPSFISSMQIEPYNSSIIVNVPDKNLDQPSPNLFTFVGGTNTTYYLIRIEDVLYMDVNITFHMKDPQVVPNNATTTITATDIDPVALKVVAPAGPNYYLQLNGKEFDDSSGVYWDPRSSNEAIVVFYENTVARVELALLSAIVPLEVNSGEIISIANSQRYTQLYLPFTGHVHLNAYGMSGFFYLEENSENGDFEGEADLILTHYSVAYIMSYAPFNVTFTHKASNILCLSCGSTVGTETSSSEASETSTESPTSNTAVTTGSITPPSDEGEDNAASLTTFSFLTFTTVLAVASL